LLDTQFSPHSGHCQRLAERVCNSIVEGCPVVVIQFLETFDECQQLSKWVVTYGHDLSIRVYLRPRRISNRTIQVSGFRLALQQRGKIDPIAMDEREYTIKNC
jgi:hypothetical protein